MGRPLLSARRRVRLTRAQLLSALLVGILLPGANAVVTVAEQEVPSGLAALLIASVPLWVLLMRRAAGEPVSRAGVGAALLGFAGVALLLRPGEQSGANAPLSKVATYAYVNPVVAILLGWLVLDEVITPVTVVGAAIIVVAVALVVREQSVRRA